MIHLKSYNESLINEKFNLAEYVANKHSGQIYDKGEKSQPYIYHILQVKRVCDRFINLYDWTDNDRYVIETAVMCHDLLEDTDTSIEELEQLFGEEVTQIVFNVSGFGANRKERNQDAYVKIPRDERSVFVKLCDRISNVEESRTNVDKMKMYKKEYPEFKERVFTGKFLEMWEYLDSLFKNN